ncbi:hypothetical protein IV498_03340 [Paenarthrobacter sp. Z7-10]|nr:hypothetical protein [Paenarthrobacter sp. Z7-10]
MKRSWRRWLPAAVVPAVIAAAVLASGIQASAVGQLPAKTPQELIAMVSQSSVRQFSGTLEQSSHLGLPELPAAAPAAAAGALEFLTGSHSARIYVDGPQRLRVQVMDQLAERDLVRNGNQVWGYNSKDNSAMDWTSPAPPTKSAPAEPAPAEGPTPGAGPTAGVGTTPKELAENFLRAVTPSTNVSVGEQVRVAGRDAYQLVLEPRSTQTLIGSVSIDVDAATGMPLAVNVRARGQQEAAASIAFSKLDLSAPPSSMFTFAPPAGATVQHGSSPQQHVPHVDSGLNGNLPFSISGMGWESVLQLPAQAASTGPNSTQLDPAQSNPAQSHSGQLNPGQLNSGALNSGALNSPLLAQATTSVAGGRLLSTALLNVYLTDDGRIFAGSVPLDRLQDAAAAK